MGSLLVSFHLQIRKLRKREVKSHVQGHPARTWQGRDFNLYCQAVWVTMLSHLSGPRHYHRCWYHSFSSHIPSFSFAFWDASSWNNHLPLPPRFQHAADRGPRSHHPLRRGLHEACGQPTVQRHVCRQREGGLCSGCEVGRGTHPRQPLPRHGALREFSSNPGRSSGGCFCCLFVTCFIPCPPACLWVWNPVPKTLPF